ncbi:hypothetical protein SISSUDRAFT_1067848 [Sistotremastrum suecicum HHB10207 ss-3]|uniref:F-box domain-containing protein n=1 Tax=Sistotremastrum suecicum HHB10207 ss-3 TaxID=1314776 RepID=A0A165WMD0_9AGAM|nr:hypothetical protein SISSUDRAFT_1067848 [Sistotremastrum suecicum HHB10207 ss-3]
MVAEDWKARHFMRKLVQRSGKIGAQALDESVENLINILQAATKHVESIREIVKIDRSADTLRSKANDLHEAAQATMKSLSAAFSETTSALNRESNLDTAFSRAFPREIQADILSRYVQLTCEDEFYEGYSYGKQKYRTRRTSDAPDWAHIMLVCSTWFHIARTDPRFWTAINFAWSRWKIAKYLTLSKNAELDLSIPTHTDTILDDEETQLLLKHVNRARSIEFHPFCGFLSAAVGLIEAEPPRNSVLCLLSDIINQNLAPSLAHLMVRGGGHTYSLPSSVSFLSLRTLELRGCLVKGNWAETIPASLLELRVHYSEVHVDEGDLFTLLRHCSNLEVLIFSGNEISTREPDQLLAWTENSAMSVKNLRKLQPWPLPKHELEQMFRICTFNRLTELNIILQHPTPPLPPTCLSAHMARSTSLELRVGYDFIKVIFSDSRSSSLNVQYSLELKIHGESKKELQS